MAKNNKKNSGCATWLFIFIVIGVLGSCFRDNDKKDDKMQTTKYISENLSSSTQITELSEQEYKSMCKEYYNDDFFKDTPKNNTYVKFYGFTGNKYIYSASEMQGIIVKDITEKYNLERNCVACTVMHESTKNDKNPSYFGDSVYIMFEKNGEFSFNEMCSGKYITIYGEIIQIKNGIYILPKYIEYTK